MGFFSWLTSDTEKSIANHWSNRETFPVHMVTEDGQVFTENDYEGYGVFGGKDMYVLIAEMNGYKGADDEETRQLAFEKIWVRGIKKGDKKYYHNWNGGEGNFMKYDDPIPTEDNMCANDLVSQHGWECFGDSGDFQDWADAGIKVPKLVEELPKDKKNWKNWWNSLPYPVSCPDQGFFYAEEDEECDECGSLMDGGDCPNCDAQD